MKPNSDQVIIVGGGPVGLVCAYRLVKEDVPVLVLDENPGLQDDPRAATIHPATLELLAQLGVVGQVIHEGLICPIFRFWDRPTGKMVAEFDHGLLKNDTDFPFVVQCEQFKLTRILAKLINDIVGAKLKFASRVQDIEQSEDRISVSVASDDGIEKYYGRYLIGADGGRSTVRRKSKIAFEGFTWPERFLVLSTPFDFELNSGMCYRNYISDPDEWCNCFKVPGDGPPGLWRTVYPVDPNASRGSLLEEHFVQQKLHSFFPLNKEYKLVHRNLYTVHQRVAETFRKGRVILAGDAAHVNNSIGGMGLNGGIQDAMSLGGKLVKLWKQEANDNLLDQYDKERRTFARDFVQTQTIQNKSRLEAKEPEKRKKYLKELSLTASDKSRAREFMLKSSMIEAMRRIEKRPVVSYRATHPFGGLPLPG